MRKTNEKLAENNIKGITLIALVITIIVILILAGVSINMLTGENGILTQAKRAKEETEISTEKEALQLTMINREMSDDEKYNIGEELKDRTLANGDDWKIISINDTNKIYDTGYYFVGKGTNLENYGETKNEWIINYDTGEVIQLPEDGYTKLEYGQNLAVKDGLILNADPVNMSDENSWGEGVTVYGIEEGDGYGWNETEFKLDGVDDYIEVYPSADVNMEKGFTFEFYGRSDAQKFSMLAKTVIGDEINATNRFRTVWENNGFGCCMSGGNSNSTWAMENKLHWIRKEDNIGTMNSQDGGYITLTVNVEENIVSLYWDGVFAGMTVCDHN